MLRAPLRGGTALARRPAVTSPQPAARSFPAAAAPAVRRIAPPVRPARRRRLARAVLAGVASGALLAAATAPLGLGKLVFVALVPWLCASVRSARGGAIGGFACGVVYFGAGFAWVPLGLGGGLLWAAFAIGVPWLAAWIAALGGAIGALAARGRRGLALAAAPLAWALLEAWRAAGPVGIPWLRLAPALAPWPAWIQPAALGGAALVTGWIVAANAALAAAALAPARRIAALVGVAGLVLVPAGLGALRIAIAPAAPDAGPALRVAVVQPHLLPGRRHVPAHFDANLERLLALSAGVAERADVVVWPESAFERWGSDEGDPFLGAVANYLEVPLLAGLRRPGPEPRQRWNSVALAAPDGRTRIAGDKVRPVPVYERAPDFALARWLDGAGLWPGRVRAAAAPGLTPLPAAPTDAGARAGILVCVDSAHPALARTLRRRGARWLVSPANEAESGAWVARQHAALVRLRAVESGLPLVRAANTGPSLWIDPLGRELARLEAGRPASGVATLGAPRPPTPYVRGGDAVAWALLALPPLALLGRRPGRAACRGDARRGARRATRGDPGR